MNNGTEDKSEQFEHPQDDTQIKIDMAAQDLLQAQAHDFYERMAQTDFEERLVLATERFQTHPADITLGARFIIEQDARAPVEVHVLQYEFNPAGPNEDEKHLVYFMYIPSQQGTIRAFVSGTITDTGTEQEMVARKNTQVLDKGQGIASVLEMANQALLQDIAFRRNKKLRQLVVDQNLSDIQNLESYAEEKANPLLSLIARIKRMEERKRWESTFGQEARAKLGLNEQGEKVFSNEAPTGYQSFKPNELIHLRRAGISLVPDITARDTLFQPDDIPGQTSEEINLVLNETSRINSYLKQKTSQLQQEVETF